MECNDPPFPGRQEAMQQLNTTTKRKFPYLHFAISCSRFSQYHTRLLPRLWIVNCTTQDR